MASAFQEAVGLIFRLCLAKIGLSIMLHVAGLGRPPPSQTSSACAAPNGLYEAVGALGGFLGLDVLSSIGLSFLVIQHIAAKKPPHLRLRLLVLLAIALSAVGTGLVVATCVYVMEIKVGLVVCLSVGVRACFYATVAVV